MFGGDNKKKKLAIDAKMIKHLHEKNYHAEVDQLLKRYANLGLDKEMVEAVVA